jgi:ribose 5-phosphate isomerase A
VQNNLAPGGRDQPGKIIFAPHCQTNIMANELEKELAAKEAVKSIKNGQIIGLGTGSSAYFATLEVGRLVKEGLQVQAVPTSESTRELALSLNIPLIDINEVDAIDVTIDGADEFTTSLDLIKGGGAALLREKVVASLTRYQIIITDPSKQVDQLGRFKVPIEVIPFASRYVLNQLRAMGGEGVVRVKEGKTVYTDQGNVIVDGDFGLISQPAELGKQLKQVLGIVEHGLFTGLAHKVIMGANGGIVVFE